ncbi:MAG: NERD domain-containing protein [Clostridia bacterium]|jgi:superfamily I DNA/RNA helicase|nr:NERD domain-containing protein [Clostridia bacterium]
MAIVIPELDPITIENPGEREFYFLARELPKEYTVLYSYKYKSSDFNKVEKVREADFVIVHPALGYLVIEVKQGEISYFNNCWYEYKNNNYTPLSKNPVEQAEKAMYVILQQYMEKAKGSFPLKIKYAVCFPECKKVTGQLPSNIDENSIFLADDLLKLEDKILDLFNAKDKKNERAAIDLLLNKVLSPAFKIFAKLEDKIQMYHQQSERILTEEQERILEETELDKKKLFFGAAGTGKTFIAMEKAKRIISSEEKKVLFTCYNKNLAKYLQANLPQKIRTGNFHNLLEEILREKGITFNAPEDFNSLDKYFHETLPGMVFDYFTQASEEEKYKAIIVDEGQDFRSDWLMCLESMLQGDGIFYIFADPNQSLFNSEIHDLKKMPVSKHRLTKNMRNTEVINKWVKDFVPHLKEFPLKSFIKGGFPVSYFSWQNLKEERKLIEQEIGRLVSQGIQPRRILILSPYRKEKSSLAEVTKLKNWPIVGIDTNDTNSVRFATIRSFKGLEADIVFLIGLQRESLVCTDADIYVGGSRARFLLYVFHSENWLQTKIN